MCVELEEVCFQRADFRHPRIGIAGTSATFSLGDQWGASGGAPEAALGLELA